MQKNKPETNNAIVSLFKFNLRYGRKKSTQLPTVLLLIFIIIVGVSPNFESYIVSQFIVGAALGWYRINAIVLGMHACCSVHLSVVGFLKKKLFHRFSLCC